MSRLTWQDSGGRQNFIYIGQIEPKLYTHCWSRVKTPYTLDGLYRYLFLSGTLIKCKMTKTNLLDLSTISFTVAEQYMTWIKKR
jgi:hypothetical protein